MNNFLIGIGKRIKIIRKKQKLTINEVATNAGVSNGLISRIENGRTIPSLPVLLELISALKIDASTFFKDIENSQSRKYIHISKKQQQLIEKEVEAEGFTYHHIFSKSLSAIGFEAVILNITPNSKREKVVTDAWEFKYIISGSCTYYIGEDKIIVNKGDSLYFNGKTPHLPYNHTAQDCTMLVLYFFIDAS
ncbi:helix-turn-helix domain-containing protein [Tenacibaculum soleae]|uniref:DNA-binding protein n=1 Tax=Tenacibaculum soleae TaxID=447689 RepID=A0A1B9Y3L5_9FLAO|nr:XRE family transcriptional regulator [Tenacibaculum soleae]MDO6813180.1 XRE family transcriptional regulator [Tenacibaculum soleae]OCK44301.1 DNA-binding protein [Tenacibaculum soleae]